MKGRVKKTTWMGYGAPEWLKIWENDAIRAVGCLNMMGDRDCCPGDYVSNLVRDGVIEKDELETAILAWLNAVPSEWVGKPNLYTRDKMAEVAWATEHCRLYGVADWFVGHFEEMMSLFRTELDFFEDWKTEVVLVALCAKDISHIDARLRDILSSDGIDLPKYRYLKMRLLKKLNASA